MEKFSWSIRFKLSGCEHQPERVSVRFSQPYALRQILKLEFDVSLSVRRPGSGEHVHRFGDDR